MGHSVIDSKNTNHEPKLSTETLERQFMMSFFDSIPLALNLWDSDLNNIMCNKQVLNIFGVESQEEYLNNFHKFSPEVQPNGVSTAEMFHRNIAIVRRDGFHRFKWLHLDNNGQELPAEITLTKLPSQNEKEYIVGAVRDLRPEFNQLNETDEDEFYFLNKIPEKTFLSKLAVMSDDLIFAVDSRTSSVRFLGNAMQGTIVNESSEYVMSEAYNENYVHKDDIELYKELIDNMSKGIKKPIDLRFIQPDNTYKYYRIIYEFIFNKQDHPIIIIGKGIDISENKILQEQTRFDSLTECYNKINVETLIEQQLKKDRSLTSALLFVDINDFKSFNENYGHFSGDEILKQLISRVKSWSDSNDIIGRIGGDEFVVYVYDASNKVNFKKRIESLLASINDEYNIQGANVRVRVCVGISYCDDGCNSYETCIQRADRALLVAKISKETDWLFYDETIENYSISAIDKVSKASKISGLNVDHSLTSSIFNILYERNSDLTSINSALQYLAQSYGASRCFVAESFDNGATYSCTYEWCKEDFPSHLKSGRPISSDLIVDLLGHASVTGVYACEDIQTSGLNSSLVDALNKSKAKALLQAQVKKDNIVTFFICVEDCVKSRAWTEVQINTLMYMTRVFSIVLQGKHLHEEVRLLSEHNKISAFVGDNTDNFIYIVDPDNYQLLYMNKKALEMYGNPSESEWKTKKCYELLHNKTAPCEFCTNQYTTENEFYEWNYFNPRFNKTYLFKDKLVQLNGKLVKLQVATDITKIVSLEEELKHRLQEQSLLLECIKMLHTGDSPDASIGKILSIVCHFFSASRGVIIQVSQDAKTISNTHEWTDVGILPQMDNLQNVPAKVLLPIFNMFVNKEVFYMNDVLKTFEAGSKLYSILNDRGANDIICASIRDAGNNFLGMFALDNPKCNTDKYWLLGSLSGFVSDFLEKSNLIASLNQLSYYDTMTMVKNRESYRKALKEIDESNVTSLGVAYVDISGLSKINEEKGTRYGDEVIKRMSRILSEIFDENIYRVGGDEFVVLEKNLSEIVFEGKINSLKNAILEDPEINASIGFTWNTNIDEETDESTQYNSITNNSNYSAILSNNLENEIKSGKYIVYLQPQINLQTNELDGAEALIRRIDAGGNLQSPISFVPFYEKEGMISLIDLHVFETVCKLLSGWKEQGIGTNIKFSVNCSRSTIMEKDIVSKLSAICEKYDVPKSMFVIEITETITHSDDNVFSYVISSLKNAGFCVSLDDFGTGYSNLSSLLISDFDEIKIDMGLTKTVHIDNKSRVLTKVALNLCNEFEDMVSVAEGIETQEQFDILKDLNCHKGQGYYLSKPISIKDFEEKYFSVIR